MIETLHCDNPECSSQILHRFIHFAGKKAMDISGISEATIERFIEKGFLKTYHDFYHLDCYRNEIVQMDGFGDIRKSWIPLRKAAILHLRGIW